MDLYLIAHKVRGETAFDIAERQPCPECTPNSLCTECDSLGHWWIISTSGHRAYPWWSMPIIVQAGTDSLAIFSPDFRLAAIPFMPDNWPDHYPSKASPKPNSGKLLLVQLGLVPKPQKVVRRL